MPRPALGRQARTVVGSTKITAIEKDLLEKQYGTVHAGLRVALNAYLAGEGSVKKAPAKKKLKEVPEPAQVPVPEPAAVAEGVVPCRIHRNYKVIRRWVDRGQDWTLKRCADCGTEVTVLDHGSEDRG